MMLWIILDNSKKQFQIDWYSPLQGIDFSAHSKRKIYIYIRPSMKQNVSGVDHKWIWKL